MSRWASAYSYSRFGGNMKYGITYSRSFRYMKEVDEITLYWSTEDDIVDFIDENFDQKQRIVIDFEQEDFDTIEEAIPILENLQEVHPNFTIKISFTSQALLEKLREKGIYYFFSIFCNSWDSLYAYATLGVSDVYITEELCFNLKDVKAFCEPYKIKVRVFPNVAQVSGKDTSYIIPDVRKFFIRPEDISIYEEYVDICELWCPIEKQSVLYEIYKSEQWLGNLSDIILSFYTQVPNTGFMPYFAKARLNCRKKCYKENCRLCDMAIDIAHSMLKDGYEVSSKKKPVRDLEKMLEELKRDEPNEEDEEE